MNLVWLFCEGTDSAAMENRLDYLATPKKGHQRIQDRRSVYWLDKLPRQKRPTTVCVVTPRQMELSQPKTVHEKYRSARPPIWPVTSSAMKCTASPRVTVLAQAKQVNQNWQPDRSVYTEVSERAKTASASPRIIHLSQPKSRDSLYDLKSDYQDQRAWAEDFKKNFKIEASPRVLSLSAPKELPKEYLPERPVRWPVSEAVKSAVATERVIRLAKAKTCRDLYEGFDPYKISNAAKHAIASPRLNELCMPLPRKLKQKMV